MSKLKVFELVGAKLDPKANYLLVFDERRLNIDVLSDAVRYNQDKFKNFVFLRCIGDPNVALKVFEIPKLSGVPEEAPTTDKENK